MDSSVAGHELFVAGLFGNCVKMPKGYLETSKKLRVLTEKISPLKCPTRRSTVEHLVQYYALVARAT